MQIQKGLSLYGLRGTAAVASTKVKVVSATAAPQFV